jgi:hypothetical protein
MSTYPMVTFKWLVVYPMVTFKWLVVKYILNAKRNLSCGICTYLNLIKREDVSFFFINVNVVSYFQNIDETNTFTIIRVSDRLFDCQI